MKKDKKRTEVWRPHESNFGAQKDVLSLNTDSGSLVGSYCWPAGFWADSQYQVDFPMLLNQNDPGFETKVRAFYEQMVQQFDSERST